MNEAYADYPQGSSIAAPETGAERRGTMAA
jgi:hypothetical protein